MNSNRWCCISGRLALPNIIECHTLRSIGRLEDTGTLDLLGHDVIGCIIVRPALCCKRLESRVFLMSSSVHEINIREWDVPALTHSIDPLSASQFPFPFHQSIQNLNLKFP
jgi:hypothetical protein